MTEKMIACHEHGKRLIMGTEFPIETFITFEPWERYGYRTKPWKITVGLCNGVPEKNIRFKTKKTLSHVVFHPLHASNVQKE